MLPYAFFLSRDVSLEAYARAFIYGTLFSQRDMEFLFFAGRDTLSSYIFI